MNDLQDFQKNNEVTIAEMWDENRLEIIEDVIRKNYLNRLTEMPIAPIRKIQPLEEDLIDNVRLYKITEMAYQVGQSVTDKFTTVFNTLAAYKATVFIIMDSDGKKTEFYAGIRNNEMDENKKYSTVALGEVLKSTLVCHFPQIKIQNENRFLISELSKKIYRQQNVASVSVAGSHRSDIIRSKEDFVQGLEKLVLPMQGRQYIGIIVAENQSHQTVQRLRRAYQDLYTRLSPLQKVQFSVNGTRTALKSKSFCEMDGKEKAAVIEEVVTRLVDAMERNSVDDSMGGRIGEQIAGQLSEFINSMAANEQISGVTSASTFATAENKAVIDLLQLIEEALKRTDVYDSYGMWNVAGYFISDDMVAAEIAASNYRFLRMGENSAGGVSAVNSWRSNNLQSNGDFTDLTTYLSRFVHPRFYYGYNKHHCILTDASIAISGKELGIHLGLPRDSVCGLSVIEYTN